MIAFKVAAMGHSHLSCLQRAYQEMQQGGGATEVAARFTRLGHDQFQPNFTRSASGARQLSAELARRLEFILRRDRPDAILLSAMGNEYNSLAMIRHPEPFDFDVPGLALPFDAGARRLSYAMVQAQIRALAEQNALLFFRHLRALDIAPVYLVPPPPPIESEEHILSYPGNFRDRAQKFGLSPAPLRLKSWLVYCQTLREAVIEAGPKAWFTGLPARLAGTGYLPPQYTQSDPTHGNSLYGREVLAHVFGMMRSQEEVAA